MPSYQERLQYYNKHRARPEGFYNFRVDKVVAYLPTNKVLDGEWWQVLGVKETASLEEIKRAYRENVLLHHPDQGGRLDDFHKIQDAYAKAKARSY